MHSHSHKHSILVTSAVVSLALTSPVLASAAGTFETHAPAAIQPGQSRSDADLPGVTLSVSSPTTTSSAPSIQAIAAPSANIDASEEDELVDIVVTHVDESAEMLDKRWNNLCDGCEPSTGTKSFSGASKSLTTGRKSYPHAKKTVITKQKKKVFTTLGCKTTTTSKVKQTMYVLWVRGDDFGNDGYGRATVHRPSVLGVVAAFMLGSLLVLGR